MSGQPSDVKMDTDSDDEVHQTTSRSPSMADGTDSDSSDIKTVRSRKNVLVLEDSQSDGGSQSSEDGSEEDGCDSEGDGEDEDDESGVEEDDEGSDGSCSSSEEDESEDEKDATAVAVTQGFDSDSGDGQEDRCPICLSRFTSQSIGTPENCDHTFCLECILEWAKNMNTCPVDRKDFALVFVRKLLSGQVIEKIPVTGGQPTAGQEDEEDTTSCEVCGRSDREDRLLLCDGCDKGYHLECLFPPLDAVPVEEWFCSECARQNQNGSDSEQEMQVDGVTQPNARVTRILPRTRASEIVRRRIQRTRTLLQSTSQPSTSGIESANNSPRPNVVRRRRTVVRPRRRRKGTGRKRKRKSGVKRKRKTTKSLSSSGKKKTRRRKTKRKTGKRRTGKYSKVPKPLVTPKHRIAQHLGLKKPPKGQTLPLMRGTGVEKSIVQHRSDVGVSLRLFGDRNEFDDIAEGFSETDTMAIQRRVSSSRVLPHRKALTASALLSHRSVAMATRHPIISPGSIQVPTSSSSSFDLLGNIMSGQNLLHTIDKSVCIKRDGSLTKKQDGQLPCGRQKPSGPNSQESSGGARHGNYSANGSGGAVGGSSGERTSWSNSGRSEVSGSSRAAGSSGDTDGGGRSFQGRDRGNGGEGCSRDISTPAPKEPSCDRRNERDKKPAEEDDIDIYSDIEDTGFQAEDDDDACDSQLEPRPLSQASEFGLEKSPPNVDYDDASSEGELVIDETVKSEVDFEHEAPSAAPLPKSEDSNTDSEDDGPPNQDETNDQEVDSGHAQDAEHCQISQDNECNHESNDENPEVVDNVNSGTLELLSGNEDSTSAQLQKQSDDNERCSSSNEEMESNDSDVRPSKEEEEEVDGEGDGEGDEEKCGSADENNEANMEESSPVEEGEDAPEGDAQLPEPASPIESSEHEIVSSPDSNDNVQEDGQEDGQEDAQEDTQEQDGEYHEEVDEVSAEPAEINEPNECNDSDADSEVCLEKNENDDDSDACDPEPVDCSDSFELEKEEHCMPHTPTAPEPEAEPEPEPEQDPEPEPEPVSKPDAVEDNDIVELAVIKRVRPSLGQILARRRLRALPCSTSASASKRSQSPSGGSSSRKDSSLPRSTHSQRRVPPERVPEPEEVETTGRNLQRGGRKVSESGSGSQSSRAHRYGCPPEEYAGPRISMADLPRIPKIKRTDGGDSHGNSSGNTSGMNEVSWKKLSQNSKTRNYRDGKPKDERKYFREKEEAVLAAAAAATAAAAAKKDSYRGRESDRQSNSSSRGWVSTNVAARDKQRARGRGWDTQQPVVDRHDKTKHKHRDKEDGRVKDREKEREVEARHRAKRKATRPEKDTREKRTRRSSDSRSHETNDTTDKGPSRDRDRSWDRNKADRDKRKDRDREKDRDRKEKSSSVLPPSVSKKDKPQDAEKSTSTVTHRDTKHRHRERKKSKDKPDRERIPETIPVPVTIISSPTPEPEPYTSRESSPVESKEIYASGDSIIVNVNFSRPTSGTSTTKDGAGAEGHARSKEKELPAKRATTPLQLPPTPPEPLLMVVPFQGSKKRPGDSETTVSSKACRTGGHPKDRSWGESGFSGSEEGTRSPSCNQSDDESECMQAAAQFECGGDRDRKEIIDISSDEDSSSHKADVVEESLEVHPGEKSVEEEDKADSNVDEHANDSAKDSGSEDGNEVDIAYDPFEPTRSPSSQSMDGARTSPHIDDAAVPTESVQPEPPPLSDLPPLPPEPEPEALPVTQVPSTAPFPTREPIAVVSSPAPTTPLPMGVVSHRGLPQMLHGQNPATQTMTGPPVQHATMQMTPPMQLPNLRVPPPNFIPRSMQNAPPSGAAAAVVAAAAQMNALRPLGPWAAAAAAAAAVAGATPNLLFPPSQPLLRAGFLQPQLPGVNVPGPSHSVTLTQIGNLLQSQAAQLAMITGVRVPPPRHLNLQAANMHQAINAVTAHLGTVHSRGNYDNNNLSAVPHAALLMPVSANGETRRVSPHTAHSQRQAQQDVTEVVDMDVDSPYSPADADYLSDHNSEQSDHRPSATSHSSAPSKDRFDSLLGPGQNRKENIPSKNMGTAQSSGRGSREAKPSTPTTGSNRTNAGSGSSGHHHHHSHHQGSSRGELHRGKRKSESSRKHVMRMEVNQGAKGGSRKEKTDGDGRKDALLKVDDAQFTILDELPSSAVEMQVKEKFLKKLNRQERVVEEVKLAIKPYYNRREVNKDEYKEILRKSVPKICHNRSGEINPVKIKSLVDGYVKMFKHQRKKDIKPSKK